jgi:predicted Zn-dependent protease
LKRDDAAGEAWSKLDALPASLQSHLHAAEVHDREQRWREAAVEWRRAVDLAPERAMTKVSLAWSLFRSRDYDAAMAVLKPLLASSRADIAFLYGASLLNLQQPESAVPYLRTAISRDANLLPARAALGQALLQTGGAEEAIPLLESALSTDTDGAVHFQLFRAYQMTHREAEARDALAAYRRLRAGASR